MPALDQARGLVERRARGLAQPRRDVRIGRVHHRLADRRADAAALGGREDRVGVVHGAHVEDRGRAAEQELRARELGRSRRSPSSSSAASYGQIDLAQPVEQLEVVGAAARERLARVHVRLHEPGHHDAAGAVDDRRSRRSCGVYAPPTWTIAPSTAATSPASTRCSDRS